MNHRWSELLSAETFTAAGTKVMDIDLVDPISRLSVLMKLTNNGSVPTDHPAKALTKLEIVDGSDVLMSLSGMDIQALNFYNNMMLPYANLIYLDNVMALIEFDINFGRFLYDEQFALDCKKFRNPQLKITHNLAAGGSTPDAMELRVRADVFDEEIVSPSGFLMAKEIYSYSLVSAANEYVDLPNDHPIRTLMLLSRANAKAPYEQYNQLKLTEEQDKKTLLEGYTSDFQKVITGRYPLFTDLIYGACTAAGVDHYITPTFDAYPMLNSEGSGVAIGGPSFTNGGKKKIFGASSINFHGGYIGRCPHGAIAIPFGDQNDPDDWWDVTRLGSSRIKIKAGSSVEAASTLQVVLQQARAYK
ncbi:MAG: hypothetical protein Q8L87_18325 [Anaerolineales bacterium]|nr:hypothetical protein [Anaerolineales bacterium]